MHHYGIGIRRNHTDDVLAGHYGLPVAEVVTENYLGRGGRMRRIREAAASTSRLCLHGVSLSLGSTDPLDLEYLRRLRSLVDDVSPLVVSDHLSFAMVNGRSSYDLWPTPFTEACVRHLAQRIATVQDALGCRIAVENVSSYVRFDSDELSESAFLNAVCAEAGCGLLLDINNLYVNSVNHAFDPVEALLAIDPRHVDQIHLAGHRHIPVDSAGDGFLLDDHGSAPPDAVVDLWRAIAPALKPVPVILEWDELPPSLVEITAHVRRIETAAGASAVATNTADPSCGASS